MKRLAQLVAVLAVLLSAYVAEACTATQVLVRSENAVGTEKYDIARTVILTEVVDEVDWTKAEALHGAIGTVLREDVERGHDDLPSLLTSVANGTTLLDTPSLYPGSTHVSAGIVTVKDHLILHGYEWEHETNYLGIADAVQDLISNPDAMEATHGGTHTDRDEDAYSGRYGIERTNPWTGELVVDDPVDEPAVDEPIREPVQQDVPTSRPTQPAPVQSNPTDHAG
jgi:hypothetical protein